MIEALIVLFVILMVCLRGDDDDGYMKINEEGTRVKITSRLWKPATR